MRVLIVGDILHSRVARSNLWLLHTLGAQVVFVAPPTLLPLNTASWVEEAGLEIFHDFDEAIATKPGRRDAAAHPEGTHARPRTSPPQRSTPTCGADAERFATPQTQPQPVAILHPGPMNRGLEICTEAADATNSWVLRQVSNGVALRMAVLYLLLTDGSSAKLYAGDES